jgi:tripartite-type tricarboxylate transporter receptor subunit TctC
MLRSNLLACLSALFTAFAVLISSPTLGQGYPIKPIKLVLGYAPGGGADALARLIAQRFSGAAGQSAFVENRPGASALIALQAVSTAPADGYTLLVMANSSILAQALRATQTHDIERDLAPVSMVAIQPLVLLVHPSVQAKTVKEFIALAKANPGAINYGSSGQGGASHLAGELFNLLADVKLFHVPYKGGGESVVAAASGTIQSTFASTTSAKALMDAGKLRALGVTSLNRTQLLLSAPSINESGVLGYDAVVWYSVMVPAATPAAITGQLNGLLGKMISAAEMKELFLRQGLEPQSGTIEQLRTMIRNEFVQSHKLIKAANLKAGQ